MLHLIQCQLYASLDTVSITGRQENQLLTTDCGLYSKR